MTILAVAHFYIEHNRAGGEYYLHRLLRELAKTHNVHVWVTTGKKTKDTVIDGVHVHYEQPSVKPDIVLTHFMRNSPQARELATRFKTPIVCIVHNEDPLTHIDARKYKPSDLLIFNTDWILKRFIVNAQTIVLHPPVDTEEFKTTPGDHITLVNLTKEKGSETFYQLAKLMPNEKFLGVTGGYGDSNFDHRDMPNVEIIPQTSNMKDDVYARSKIVLMPSSRETYGMVATEAMCSNIPVVAHPTLGLKENMGDAGIYINRDRYHVWAHTIRQLNDPTEYQKRQDIIRKHMETKNSQDELEETIKAIERLKK